MEMELYKPKELGTDEETKFLVQNSGVIVNNSWPSFQKIINKMLKGDLFIVPVEWSVWAEQNYPSEDVALVKKFFPKTGHALLCYCHRSFSKDQDLIDLERIYIFDPFTAKTSFSLVELDIFSLEMKSAILPGGMIIRIQRGSSWSVLEIRSHIERILEYTSLDYDKKREENLNIRIKDKRYKDDHIINDNNKGQEDKAGSIKPCNELLKHFMSTSFSVLTNIINVGKRRYLWRKNYNEVEQG